MCKVCGMRRTTGRDVRLRERIKNRKSRERNCFRRNLISGMRYRVMCAPCYRPMLCTHMSSKKRDRLRVCSPQFWMLQLSIGEAVGLADCAHADVAVDEVASGSQGLAIDFEQIEFLDLGLEYAHRRVRQ